MRKKKIHTTDRQSLIYLLVLENSHSIFSNPIYYYSGHGTHILIVPTVRAQNNRVRSGPSLFAYTIFEQKSDQTSPQSAYCTNAQVDVVFVRVWNNGGFSVGPSTYINLNSIWDTQCEKTALMPYANSEGPDQTVHPRSLIRAFSVRRYNQANVHRFCEKKRTTNALIRKQAHLTYGIRYET